LPKEREFELPGLRLAAQEWGAENELPAIAAHGWLDNAGSFDLLAPLLPGWRIVAVDLAGHGRSDFRSLDASYNIWQDVGDLIDIAEQLSWHRFTLLGHSRGAAISMLLAAAFPERVERLVLLEGGIPLTAAAEEAPENLARALNDRRNLSRKTGRVFADRETAIAERSRGFSKVSREAAAVLARRSLREVDGGFQWHADQRLKGRSELRLTPEQTAAFIERVTAPVLLFIAEQSPLVASPMHAALISGFKDVEVVRLPGGHHFHLEGGQAEIATRIRRFCG
jgi:pimeloyl-ACP methyl ester carboxylesterase